MKNSSVIRKILYALITILAVIIFNYFLFRVLPGDPISMIMRNPKASEASIEAIRASYGLDLPWYSQFVVYLKGLFTGDFGTSFVYKAPVMEVIGAKILPTVVMLGLAEIVAIIIGIFLGIMAAWKRGRCSHRTLGRQEFPGNGRGRTARTPEQSCQTGILEQSHLHGVLHPACVPG